MIRIVNNNLPLLCVFVWGGAHAPVFGSEPQRERERESEPMCVCVVCAPVPTCLWLVHTLINTNIHQRFNGTLMFIYSFIGSSACTYVSYALHLP